tara:strand:+ start:9829 stop:10515 length:687 start_codon:yes stop_codon:yes gene_type:complete
MRAPKRPIYTPPAQIRTGQYSEGAEFMSKDGLTEHIGPYHSYPNGAVYSQGSYNSLSEQLMPYAPQMEPTELIDTNERTENNSIYFKLTKKRFDMHYKPPYHYPDPKKGAYEKAFMTRYFAQRINSGNEIVEINSLEFDLRNEDNTPGIDQGLYEVYKIQWSISGPIEEVRKVNLRVILEAERNGLVNLRRYLSDLDEFHKNAHKITTPPKAPESPVISNRRNTSPRY